MRAASLIKKRVKFSLYNILLENHLIVLMLKKRKDLIDRNSSYIRRNEDTRVDITRERNNNRLGFRIRIIH
jgi:hypothetical protein